MLHMFPEYFEEKGQNVIMELKEMKKGSQILS